jgi:hypothetical protein
MSPYLPDPSRWTVPLKPSIVMLLSIRFELLVQVFFSFSSNSSYSSISHTDIHPAIFNIHIFMYVLSMYRKKILSSI